MIGFIDESGDVGFKFTKGSSKYFVVALVVFKDKEEANDCDKGIEELKKSLKLRKDSEFHYKRNPNTMRKAFLAKVCEYDFVYYTVTIDKQKLLTRDKELHSKLGMYKYSYNSLLMLAQSDISEVALVLDEVGSSQFKMDLNKHLRKNLNTEFKKVKSISHQRSRSTNLLQLADYIAGVTHASLNEKISTNSLKKIISKKKIKEKTIEE